MELEEIKDYIRKEQPNYSRAEIQDILRIRTKRSLSRVNSTMFWDAVFMGLTVAMLVGVTFIIGLKDKYIISLELIGLALCLFIHYRIKYRLLNKINFDIDLHNAAQTAIKRLSKFISIYLWIIPSSVSAIYLYTQFRLFEVTSWQWGETLSRFSLVIPIAVITLLITRGLIRIMYQRHLKALKHIVNDLA
ncbi:MAG: hypothetical protein AAF843_08460 [Bacteroidota bacterium]